MRRLLMSKDRTEGAPGPIRGGAGAVSGYSEPAAEVVDDMEPEVVDDMEPEVVDDIGKVGIKVGIKHPYLGMCTLNAHPFVVMRNMGATLHDLVHGAGSGFCASWRGSPAWRGAFLEDVGLTALNLVTTCEACHNDIRPPNIAFKDGRFCLLDFDMARGDVQFQENSAFSPKMVTRWARKSERMMCYSVAQIAVNVFVLDSPEGSDAGTAPAAASSIWSTKRDGSAVDAAFERWAAAKGALVLGFVAAVRQACTPAAARSIKLPGDYKEHLAEVLRCMLGLTPRAAPSVARRRERSEDGVAAGGSEAFAKMRKS